MKKILPNNHKKGLALSLAKGFTLIELLVVIAIIATLAVVVFVALNPGERLEDTRDARRASDINTILTAIHESIVDNGGTMPSNIPAVGTAKQLGTATDSTCGATVGGGGTNCSSLATGCVDLMLGTQNLTAYLKSMAIDPEGTGAGFASTDTGYTVIRDSNGIVTISACGVEETVGTPLTASR